jgi:hypothetical protein
MKLDPADLREYASRDWASLERMARIERARQPVATKVALGIALYEAMKHTRPTWPDSDARREDLDAHLRLRALLDRAAHVGTR